ncbi:MAG: tetratricopeptide repeat protein [Thermoguttaceae bacterium]
MSKPKKSSKKHDLQAQVGTSVSPALTFRILAGAAIIIIASLIAYLPSLSNGFIWDDDKLLTENELVKASDGLYRFWCSTNAIDYWPITNSTFWIEWRLWEMNPAGYHALNLILHIVEALLVWIILRKLSFPGAYLAALIFAVHPVNVESVAWIASRKNLMAMLFFLFSILWYLKAEMSAASSSMAPARSHGGPWQRETAHCPPSTAHCFPWYCLSLTAFLCAMLSKGSVAVLPVLLLCIIWWLRPLTRQDFAWISPFFLLAGILTKVNLWSQVRDTGTVFRSADFLERLLGAAGTVWFYLYKAILPLDLAPVYPQWHIQASYLRWWLPLLAVLGVTVVFWRHRSGWSRPFLFAWVFFCVALFPVMGFTDVGFMRHALVADRYQHIAIIGVISLATAGLSAWRQRVRRKEFWATAVLAVGILAFMTCRQNAIYRDAITLNQTALEKNPDFWLGHYNLGVALEKAGNPLEAAKQYELILQHEPNHPDAHTNLAAILIREGRLPEAFDHLNLALRVNPDYPETQNNLGLALVLDHRPQEAIEHFRKALRLKPDFFEAHQNFGDALLDSGRFQEAIEQYVQAIQLKSNSPEVHYNLGVALVQAGRFQEAIDHFEQALRLRPDYAEAHNNLAALLLKIGRSQEAIEHYQQALSLEPDFIEIHYNLALAYANTRQSAKAIDAAQKALKLARSQGKTVLAGQIENWLNSYRAGLPVHPDTPPTPKSVFPPP